MNDAVVLNYHDSLLRESDVRLLEPPAWLNDRLIGFFFDYLEHEYADRAAETSSFVTPDVAQLIKLADDDEIAFVADSLRLSTKSYVFVVVNDSESTTTATNNDGTGSHWSLLVYTRHDNAFRHYDSSPFASNASSARRTALKLTPYLFAANPRFVDVADCPKQANGYDCGVHVVSVADYLARHYFGDDRRSIGEAVDASVVVAQRRRLHDLIYGLARKQRESQAT